MAIRPPASYSSPVVVHREVSPSRWDAYVRRHPDASGYHYLAWCDVIAAAFGHDVRALAAESAQGLVGVLPFVIIRSWLFGRFAVSLPFVNYGGVLADSPAVERALLDAAVAEVRRAGAASIELRHRTRRYPQLAARRHKVAMTLDLQTTAGRQWEVLDRKVRNQVRKAQKSGLAARAGGVELLPAFYRVFARNMRDLGTPVYGRTLFDTILATFPDRTRIVVVCRGETPVAAGLMYWHRDTCEAPWASSIREFNPLCPNTLLYWEMLQYAIGAGFRRFDFGRSTPHEGTYHFKRQWGAVPEDLVWETWSAAGTGVRDLSPKNPRFRRAIGLWRRLPVPVASLLGPSIVRSLP